MASRNTRYIYYIDNRNHLHRIVVPVQWGSGATSHQRAVSTSANLINTFRQRYPDANVDEISSASRDNWGQALSAMHMSITLNGRGIKVENAFQGGKVYVGPSGTIRDTSQALRMSPWQAKQPYRDLQNQGYRLDHFQLPGTNIRFSLRPPTAFYDWIYMNALLRHPQMSQHILQHNAFSDVWAIPGQTVNSQAKACALFTALERQYGKTYTRAPQTGRNVNVVSRLLEPQNLSHFIAMEKHYDNEMQNTAPEQDAQASADQNGAAVRATNTAPNKPIQVSPQTRLVLALRQVPGVSDREITNVLSRYPKAKVNDSFDFAKNLMIKGLKNYLNSTDLKPQDQWGQALQAADNEISNVNSANNKTNHKIHVISFMSKGYPKNLRTVKTADYPPVLYVKGDPKVLNTEMVNITGSRNIDKSKESDVYRTATAECAKAMAKNHLTEVGGLSNGTEALAQRTALESGGKSVAVMPESLDQPVYPPNNRGLAQQILSHGGALISAYPTGTKIDWNHNKDLTVKHLKEYSKWQTGLADGTIPITGTSKDGTADTVDHAIEQGRPVGAPSYVNLNTPHTPDEQLPNDISSNPKDKVSNLNAFAARIHNHRLERDKALKSKGHIKTNQYPQPIKADKATRLLLALRLVPGVSDKSIVNALSKQPKSKISDSFDYAKKLPISGLDMYFHNGSSVPEGQWNTALKNADKELRNVNRANRINTRTNGKIHIITFMSKDYPKQLKNVKTHNFPAVLYVQGDPELLNHKSVAVVGSRKETKAGKKVAAKYARGLAKHGYTDIGGLAYGTDVTAHLNAIKAGGKSIAVMPESLDQPVYPASNNWIANKILRHGGALVSTYPTHNGMEWNVHKSRSIKHLIERDQWQSGLANGVIPVEGTKRSGTRHVIESAEAQGKPVGVPDYQDILGSDYQHDSDQELPQELIQEHPQDKLSSLNDFTKRMNKADKDRSADLVKQDRRTYNAEQPTPVKRHNLFIYKAYPVKKMADKKDYVMVDIRRYGGSKKHESKPLADWNPKPSATRMRTHIVPMRLKDFNKIRKMHSKKALGVGQSIPKHELTFRAKVVPTIYGYGIKPKTIRKASKRLNYSKVTSAAERRDYKEKESEGLIKSKPSNVKETQQSKSEDKSAPEK